MTEEKQRHSKESHRIHITHLHSTDGGGQAMYDELRVL